ncbi:mRNA capping enzyme [Emericellopsis atlantica]|uniref:mRNA cap guanine-N(7) methyltransferase n=1 Tax=Emericellopsis atlantica TaxID=2614577 RepID=A0A9P8CPM3_9HYPO|nr:mRNA capping enzyme [Emericellopsis atlantica]KAG9254698.1 mRNA capping enzyme [Emericellopsis atlantica]
MTNPDSAASAAQNGKRRAEDDPSQDDLPQPYNAQQLQPAKRRALSPSEQPRKQKRPGARARISESQREAYRQRQAQRERETEELARAQREQSARRGGLHDVVREHYNNVPQRGREWRTTDSKIKGLRVFNNWIKSCIIQRYSPDEDHTPGSREQGRSSGRELCVLDIGCGKGGDLNKWQAAPQPIQLYVGLDPADVSIAQARERYNQLRSRGGRGGRRGRLFDGRFHVKDCYGESIEDLQIIQHMGFDPSPMNHRGFDVVTMMFSMHYAFESEERARTMLRNVAGALKKGGRFIGCIPNSDVLGQHVREFNKKQAAKRAGASGEEKKDAEKSNGDDGQPLIAESPPPSDDGQPLIAESPPGSPLAQPLIVATPEPEEPSVEINNHAQGDKTPEPMEPGAEVATGASEPQAPKEDGKADDKEEGEVAVEPSAEWGNSIYRVRFPGKTPEDGIFRPPFGWKYSFFLDEAVEEVPEYVVPWEAFRALADDFNLELQFHRTFRDIYEAEKDDREMGPLSERMGVRERGGGRLLVSDEEMEAASFYIGFCFYKV